jgi:hypothetical protein
MVTPQRMEVFAAIQRENERVAAALGTAISRIDDSILEGDPAQPEMGHLPHLDIGHTPPLWAFVTLSLSNLSNSG